MEHLTPHTRRHLPADDFNGVEPTPVLLVHRGAVSLHDLVELFQDRRLEVFCARNLSPEWIAFARRASATLIVDDNPIGALVYAATAKTDGPVVVVLTSDQEHMRDDLIRAGAADCVTCRFHHPMSSASFRCASVGTRRRTCTTRSGFCSTPSVG